MKKTMPLDLLSSIKGARSSEAVDELFNVINRAVPENQAMGHLSMDANAISINELRDDKIERCSDSVKDLIRKNFPKEKDGFLVVPKVIEE